MNYKAAKSFILDKLENQLAPDLTYHGLHHTLDVLRVTEELCDLENIDGYNTLLLKTAALYHDSGFVINNINHEELGCKIVRKFLPEFGYSDRDIEKICGMIMATKIPQSPKNIMEQILCDADLDYLGREDFFEIGDSLYQEFLAYNVVDNFEDWNRIQVKFLSNHQFFTDTNVTRRNSRKAQYLKNLEEVVATYQEK